MKNTYSYVDALNEVLTMALSAQCKEKLTVLRDQVAKRNASKSNKPTPKQIANEGVKERIVEVLGESESPLTIPEIISALGVDFSSQKVSALLTQLIKAEKVCKTYEKKVAYFGLV